MIVQHKSFRVQIENLALGGERARGDSGCIRPLRARVFRPSLELRVR